MYVDWKSLSISLIISIIVNGLAGFYVIFEYLNKMTRLINNLLTENLTANLGDTTNNKVAITVAQGQGLSFEIWGLFFVISFVILTIICYLSLNFYKKKISSRYNENNKK
jgi:uncharacterized membrane protein